MLGVWCGRKGVGGRTLEDLEVLEVRVLSVDIELDTCHWDIHVNRVEDLAKSRSANCQQYIPLLFLSSLLIAALCPSLKLRPGVARKAGYEGLNIPSSTLLNLGDVQLQQAVEPRDKLLSTHRQ